MRVILAMVAMFLLGAYYYFTNDMTPLVMFAAIYAGYEVVSRISRLEILKIPLLFGLIFVSVRTGFQYLGYPEDTFLYLLSAGFSLAIPTLKHRFNFIPSIAGMILIGAAFFLIPNIYPLNQLRIPLALSVLVIALTAMFPVISEKMEFLVDHRPFLVFLTLVTSIYYTQFRETLYAGFRSLGDWVIIALTLMYFIEKFRFEIEKAAPESLKISDFDGFVERAEKAYIEDGDPVPLLSFISYTLFKSGRDFNDVEKFFRVFVEKEKIPKYTFGFERQLIMKRRKSKRMERINMIKRMFEEIGGGDERG